jgi:Mitochondrial carrier protein
MGAHIVFTVRTSNRGIDNQYKYRYEYQRLLHRQRIQAPQMSAVSVPSPTSVDAHGPNITTSTTRRPDSTTNVKSSKSGNDVTRRMLCGGLSGMIAKTVTNPLERVKMLAQTGEYTSATAAATATKSSTTTAAATTTTNGLFSTIQNMTNIYRSIIRNEGVLGLWAGNGINLLRVFPNKAIIFSTNDIYTRYLQLWYFRHATPTNHSAPSADVLPPLYSFIAGGLAGSTATLVTYPLDLARGRIAGKVGMVAAITDAAASTATTTTTTSTATTMKPKVYNGMIQTILVTVKDEGIAGLYKGVTPTLLGAMPYVGIQFGTVGLLEKYFDRNSSSNNSHNLNIGGEKKKQHDPLQKMVFGGISGIVAGAITYPNDTVRRMMQLQGSRGTVVQYNGYMHCLTSIVQEHGVSRLYRGWTINMIRMAPNTAVVFGSYEFLKQLTARWSF